MHGCTYAEDNGERSEAGKIRSQEFMPSKVRLKFLKKKRLF